VQDQTVTRYREWDDVFGYCRYSANPVGRLVLCLCGYRDAARQRLSDATCTALQLANFWQDVARDYDRGRIYLPQENCRRAGYDEAMFAHHEFNPQFRRLLADEVDRAESFLRAGRPRQFVPGLQGEVEAGRAESCGNLVFNLDPAILDPHDAGDLVEWPRENGVFEPAVLDFDPHVGL
jgi:phytoene/squalene synthetase